MIRSRAGFRQALLDTDVPRYGPEWEEIMDKASHARIDPDRMFTFFMSLEEAGA